MAHDRPGFSFPGAIGKSRKERIAGGITGWMNRKSGDTLFVFNRQGSFVKQFYFDFGSEAMFPGIDQVSVWKMLLIFVIGSTRNKNTGRLF